MEVHNDLIVFVSCQINAEIISRLKCIDVVEVEEGVMPARTSKSDVERLPACFVVHTLTVSVTNGCCQVQNPLFQEVNTNKSMHHE